MGVRPSREAFERVRDQIGFCGIWCGSCAVGNGCMTELGAGLRDLLTAYDAPEWATVDVGWEGFLMALGSLRHTICCAGCREGGGRVNCEIRACALGRAIKNCTDCPSFGRCEHAGILDRMRSGAAGVGMSVLSPGQEPEAVLPQWTRAVMSRWPCCVLFAEGG